MKTRSSVRFHTFWYVFAPHSASTHAKPRNRTLHRANAEKTPKTLQKPRFHQTKLTKSPNIIAHAANVENDHKNKTMMKVSNKL